MGRDRLQTDRNVFLGELPAGYDLKRALFPVFGRSHFFCCLRRLDYKKRVHGTEKGYALQGIRIALTDGIVVQIRHH